MTKIRRARAARAGSPPSGVDLLFGLVSYFGCGKFIERSNKLAGDFKVLGLTDLSRSIIPFFNKYPFIGAKGISFNALCL